MSELCDLARKHGTDKVAHGYTRWYDRWFAPLRERPITLLDFGVWQGASIRMWHEFFPRAEIYAVDVRPERLATVAGLPRVRTAVLHQGIAEKWQEFKNRFPDARFDIVIDDTSHVPRDQWTSFKQLFPLVTPEGFYVVEDLHPPSVFIRGRHAFVDALAGLVNDRLAGRDALLAGGVNVQFLGTLVVIRKAVQTSGAVDGLRFGRRGFETGV